MKITPSIAKIHTFIKEKQLIGPNHTIIVGLSGGPDSVFLLHVLVAFQSISPITLIAAHLDHEWRAQSHQDVIFCQQLCDRLAVRLVSRKISDLSLNLKFNGSQEDMGRKARRFFLEQVCAENKAQAIAVGHHAQDQQETFFIRLLRGTSLSGLTAMKPSEGNYIRPLLLTDKTEIMAYLELHAITFIIDSSNESMAYLHNRIRATVIPALKTCDARFDTNFLNTLERLQETESFLEDITCQTFHTIASQTDVWRINCKRLIDLHPILRYRLILYWFCMERIPFTPSQAFFDEVLRFLDSTDSKKHALHTHWVIVKRKNLSWVEKII
jgi:tRNA(Ile)-lysidine synthase